VGEVELAFELKQHYFKARCQDPACKAFLGGFHIPCTAGWVVMVCWKCRKASAFRNGPDGFDAILVGELKELKRDLELEQRAPTARR
jgi:hypothetical protein